MHEFRPKPNVDMWTDTKTFLVSTKSTNNLGNKGDFKRNNYSEDNIREPYIDIQQNFRTPDSVVFSPFSRNQHKRRYQGIFRTKK